MFKTNQIAKIFLSIRTQDWWESKFGPLFGIIYATSVLLQINLNNAVTSILFILVALIPGACFVSIINDLTDIEIDKKVGKRNFFDHRSTSLGYLLILVCVISGIFFSFFLNQVSFIFYLAAWLTFFSYSVPPLRFKTRGVLGIFCDSLGAYVFPYLFTISVITFSFHKQLNIYWLVSVAIWSFCLGLRGILSHQLTDKKNDNTTETKTFVQNHKTSTIKKFAALVIFPIEIISFGSIIFISQNYFVLLFLLIYLIKTVSLFYLHEIKFAILNTSKSHRLFLNDYYSVLLPISFIVFALTDLTNNWIVIALHIILFAKSILRVVMESCQILYNLYYKLREFLLSH